jgi:DNA-binding transcriptional MerR regulator
MSKQTIPDKKERERFRRYQEEDILQRLFFIFYNCMTEINNGLSAVYINGIISMGSQPRGTSFIGAK